MASLGRVTLPAPPGLHAGGSLQVRLSDHVLGRLCCYTRPCAVAAANQTSWLSRGIVGHLYRVALGDVVLGEVWLVYVSSSSSVVSMLSSSSASLGSALGVPGGVGSVGSSVSSVSSESYSSVSDGSVRLALVLPPRLVDDETVGSVGLPPAESGFLGGLGALLGVGSHRWEGVPTAVLRAYSCFGFGFLFALWAKFRGHFARCVMLRCHRGVVGVVDASSSRLDGGPEGAEGCRWLLRGRRAGLPPLFTCRGVLRAGVLACGVG